LLSVLVLFCCGLACAKTRWKVRGFFRDARAARIMRELHPPRARSCRESCAKPLGMVLVNQSGLIMKLRGMNLRLRPEIPRRTPGCVFGDPAAFFLFLFDRRWSFL